MKFLFVVLTLLFLGSISPSFGQNKNSRKSSVEIIDFGDSEKKTKSKSTYPMIIKTSPIAPIMGKGLIELEREITDYMSIQVGVGLTFKPLVNFNLAKILELDEDESYCSSTQWENDICDYVNSLEYRNSNIGFLMSLSPRFYFESDGFEGSYIAPFIRYSNYRYSVQGIDESARYELRDPNNLVKESVNYMDYGVHYGFQVIYPKLTAEYFIGIGARKESSTRQDLGIDSGGVYRNGLTNIKKSSLLLEIGMRLGFQL